MLGGEEEHRLLELGLVLDEGVVAAEDELRRTLLGSLLQKVLGKLALVPLDGADQVSATFIKPLGEWDGGEKIVRSDRPADIQKTVHKTHHYLIFPTHLGIRL